MPWILYRGGVQSEYLRLPDDGEIILLTGSVDARIRGGHCLFADAYIEQLQFLVEETGASVDFVTVLRHPRNTYALLPEPSDLGHKLGP